MSDDVEKDSVISERIHDADHEVNEKMVHWLHWFLTDGDVSLDELKETFQKAYDKQEGIDFPWAP